GILAATATSGALIAIVSRTTTAARPFNMIAAHLVGAQRADAFGFVPVVTIPGIALHVLLVTLAGIAVAMVARRRLAPAWLASITLALISALVSIGIARRGGSSLAELLTVGDLLLFHVVLAVSLTLGIRFAFFDTRKNRGTRIESM
ncbi:MAG: hypothetical protein ABIR92_06540, partial [Gemmatimonadaceae bacterium]